MMSYVFAVLCCIFPIQVCVEVGSKWQGELLPLTAVEEWTAFAENTNETVMNEANEEEKRDIFNNGTARVTTAVPSNSTLGSPTIIASTTSALSFSVVTSLNMTNFTNTTNSSDITTNSNTTLDPNNTVDSNTTVANFTTPALSFSVATSLNMTNATNTTDSPDTTTKVNTTLDPNNTVDLNTTTNYTNTATATNTTTTTTTAPTIASTTVTTATPTKTIPTATKPTTSQAPTTPQTTPTSHTQTQTTPTTATQITTSIPTLTTTTQALTTNLPRVTTTGKPLPFNVTFAPSPALVDKLSVEPQKLRCEVDKSSPDEIHITSIVVQRTSDAGVNMTFALITAYAAAHAADVNDTTVRVSGDVNPSSIGEFLEIQWPQPAEATLGKYYCEVFGLDGLGHPLSIIEAASVSAPTVSLDDVINIVMTLQQGQKRIQEEIAQLTADCNACTASGKRAVGVVEEQVSPLTY